MHKRDYLLPCRPPQILNPIFTEIFFHLRFSDVIKAYLGPMERKTLTWRPFGECAKVSCCESAGQSSLVKG